MLRDGAHDPALGEPGRPPAALDRSIVLVGLMGAGKTSIGRRLAARLGLPFREPTRRSSWPPAAPSPSCSTATGSATFRDGERRVIRRLLAGARSFWRPAAAPSWTA